MQINDSQVENSSGQGKNSDVPDSIRTWNWGAFFLNAFWGIFNRTYIALLAVVPIIGVLMVFILGFKGNEWAWQNKRWKNIEQFKRVQKLWSIWGIIFFIIGTFLSIFVVNIMLPILKFLLNSN